MITIIFIVAMVAITSFSIMDAMGLWLLVLVLHGPLVDRLGSLAVHLPLQMGLCLITVVLIRKKWQRMPFSVIALVIGIVMLMCLAALFGIDPEKSIPEIMNYGKGFLLVVMLVMLVRDKKDIQKLTLYCLAGLAVGALMAIYQYKTGTFRINTMTVKRVATLRGDPNDTAMLFVAGLSLAIYWLKESRRLVAKILAGGSFAFLVIGTILTGSRGGFLALVFVMGLIYLKSFSIKSTLGAITVVTMLIVMAPGSYWDRVNSIFSGKDLNHGGSLDHRKNLQKDGLNLALDNLALGVGSGNFGTAFFAGRNNARMGTFTGSSSLVAHNMYLEFLVENGIFGMFLFMLIIFRTFVSLRKVDAKLRPYIKNKDYFPLGYSIAVSLAGMLLSGFFLSQAKNSVLWFMIGLGLAAEFAICKAPNQEELPIQENLRLEVAA